MSSPLLHPPLVQYVISIHIDSTSLPHKGGGGALRLGLMGPSCASPTATLSLLTGLKGALSHGISELPGSTMSFTGGGGEAGLDAA